MKNDFDRFISRLDVAEERCSELEDISVESSKIKKQKTQFKEKEQASEPYMAGCWNYQTRNLKQL